VTDLSTAHVAAIEYLFGGKPSDSFNLGTGQGLSVLEVLEETMRATATRFAVRRMPRRPGDPPVLVADPRKANGILRWSARHSDIGEIVASAWNWHRKQAERLRDY
jgi:UDP-glucose 4-epimerase